MIETSSLHEEFNNIVEGLTAAEAVGAADLSVPGPISEGQPAAPTTFEVLARTPDAIADSLTRLVVANSTTDYTMPEGEKD